MTSAENPALSFYYQYYYYYHNYYFQSYTELCLLKQGGLKYRQYTFLPLVLQICDPPACLQSLANSASVLICNATHTSQLIRKNKAHSEQACFQQQDCSFQGQTDSRDDVRHCQIKIQTEMQRHQCHSTDITQIQFIWTQASYCCVVAGGFNPKDFTRIWSSWHVTVQILLHLPCKPTSNSNRSNSPLTAASVSHLLALDSSN